MAKGAPQDDFVEFIEGLLAKHGPDSQGAVGWFRGDADARYRVMLELVRPTTSPVSLLDFGCGLAGLYDYVQRQRLPNIEYTGLDISGKLLTIARQRYPEVTFHQFDVLDAQAPPLALCDYVVMNGIFTYRGEHSNEEMFTYLRRLVSRVFESVRIGLAFNVITPYVDWLRDDLFHLPVDELLGFLSRQISRHVVIRHDYGLYEYTAYVYRDPSDPSQEATKRLVARP
jgi:SAM-dependent methyltransferase